MKIPIVNYFLNSIENQPLPEITLDDVEETLKRAELESLQQRKDDILAKFEQETSTEVLNNEFKTPMLFTGRKPSSIRVAATASVKFNPPSTPRTPSSSRYSLRRNVPATPSSCQRKAEAISTDGFVIATPMVLSALDNFQNGPGFSNFNVPDILDFIDDDKQDVTAVEKHILHTEELTDSNVIDYLLEMTEDLVNVVDPVKPAPKPPKQRPNVWTCLDEQEEQPVRRMTRRRYLHSKRTTEELERSLRQIQKEKEKLRKIQRKERFSKKPKGTRKSSRRKQTVKYY